MLDASSNTGSTLLRYFAIGKMVGVVIGLAMILLALISLTTNLQVIDLVNWVGRYFGTTFTVFFCLLLLVSAAAIIQLKASAQKCLWYEVGMQCANGLSTLALTYTLLGISLGIGALAQESLSPENVNQVISVLTTQFSMAFMTTVVGLPSAAIVRAWVAILYVQQTSKLNEKDK
jgi:hypothetical protein